MEPIRNRLQSTRPPFSTKLTVIDPLALQEKTWECLKGVKGEYNGIVFTYQGCGMIEAGAAFGRVYRRSCDCEKTARERYKAWEQLEHWRIKQVKHTYAWLGERWSDEALATKTFANFKVERQPEAYEVVQDFAEMLVGTLILHGSFGTGKTHLLAALCNVLRTREHKPKASLFVTSPKLFNSIQERIGNKESYAKLIAQAISTPLLVIDDLDKAKWTEFREELYFEIIDERTKAGKPIAISTNRLADLERFVGGACASRLSIGQIEVEMTGEDYRREL